LDNNDERGIMESDELGAKLKGIREHRGISIDEAAQKADITPTRLLGIEAGACKPRVKTIIKIIRGWQIRSSELFLLLLIWNFGPKT
jgi:DNA-binding XRE family transcriptional regulator